MSGEWQIPECLWLPDEEPTVVEVGAVPSAEVTEDITAECLALSDVLKRAVDGRHADQLVDYLVLARF